MISSTSRADEIREETKSKREAERISLMECQREDRLRREELEREREENQRQERLRQERLDEERRNRQQRIDEENRRRLEQREDELRLRQELREEARARKEQETNNMLRFNQENKEQFQATLQTLQLQIFSEVVGKRKSTENENESNATKENPIKSIWISISSEDDSDSFPVDIPTSDFSAAKKQILEASGIGDTEGKSVIVVLEGKEAIVTDKKLVSGATYDVAFRVKEKSIKVFLTKSL